MCEFCSTRNVIDIAMEEVPKQGEILYLQEVERSSKDKSLVSGITKDSIVVFCVDTSGSMGQTTEVLLYSVTQIIQGYMSDHFVSSYTYTNYTSLVDKLIK